MAYEILNSKQSLEIEPSYFKYRHCDYSGMPPYTRIAVDLRARLDPIICQGPISVLNFK
jgi:hypothetical protein